MTTHILVVEDNADLAFGLATALETGGYEIEIAPDGEQGLTRADTAPRPSLVILDLMLPGLSGFRVLRQLRESGNTVPVLILTARTAEADKVQGLRLGADDYVTKPFGVLELLARVDALLRRVGAVPYTLPHARPAEGPSSYRFGSVEVDPPSREVRRKGAPVALAPLEFDLLLALLRRQGAVTSREELLHEVWGYQSSIVSRTVDTHIATLRDKLEDDPANPRHILTVRKKGYRVQT
jgi:DNA-binding response OmpR family regulator